MPRIPAGEIERRLCHGGRRLGVASHGENHVGISAVVHSLASKERQEISRNGIISMMSRRETPLVVEMASYNRGVTIMIGGGGPEHIGRNNRLTAAYIIISFNDYYRQQISADLSSCSTQFRNGWRNGTSKIESKVSITALYQRNSLIIGMQNNGHELENIARKAAASRRRRVMAVLVINDIMLRNCTFLLVVSGGVNYQKALSGICMLARRAFEGNILRWLFCCRK